jgi:hypothetical protein
MGGLGVRRASLLGSIGETGRGCDHGIGIGKTQSYCGLDWMRMWLWLPDSLM